MADKPIPTAAKIQKAIKDQAKLWSTRSGMSAYSWATEVTVKLGFGKASADTYQKVRELVKAELNRTSFLKSINVCGSVALSVREGTTF